jgi:hypothetical protein
MAQIFKHRIIYIYTFLLTLNISLIKIINNDKFSIDSIFYLNEIKLFDIAILFFFIFYFKDIIEFFKSNYKNKYIKLVYVFFILIFLGCFFSTFSIHTTKTENQLFVFLFLINFIKNLIGLIIFIVLVRKSPSLDISKILLFMFFILIFFIFFNFYINGHISRFYYPFTTKVNGYNLVALTYGIFFFNYLDKYLYDKNSKNRLIYLYISFLALLIVTFSFSKTGILALVLVLVFTLILNHKIIKPKIYLPVSIFLILIILILDIIKFYGTINSLSLIDLIADPFIILENYGSLFYRIEHVWLSDFDKNLNILSFLFGDGIYINKTNDSLYFSIITKFGFIGFIFFISFCLDLLLKLEQKKHNIIIFILIFSLNSEMILQSNTINPLIWIILFASFKEKNFI